MEVGAMIRGIDRARRLEPFVLQPDDDLIICRCEEITRGEIRRAVYDGMCTMNEVKRYLRAGMGLCQGQTCARLVRGIIARELGVGLDEVELSPPRAPARPVGMETYGNDGMKRLAG
jgi:bacterioferritin-associated ferredoxin